jgi:hypothetical protein
MSARMTVKQVFEYLVEGVRPRRRFARLVATATAGGASREAAEMAALRDYLGLGSQQHQCCRQHDRRCCSRS